jgi:hypothetical protein
LQWWCSRDEEGKPRDPPYDPDLSTEDGVTKATLFTTWAMQNMPGWKHWKKNLDSVVRLEGLSLSAMLEG